MKKQQKLTIALQLDRQKGILTLGTPGLGSAATRSLGQVRIRLRGENISLGKQNRTASLTEEGMLPIGIPFRPTGENPRIKVDLHLDERSLGSLDCALDGDTQERAAA